MAKLNRLALMTQPFVDSDGSLGDENGPYGREIRQQAFLPPPGQYWLRFARPRSEGEMWPREWEPANVDDSRPLRGFAMIGLHRGETRYWDLSHAEWITRTPPKGWDS